MRYFRGKLSPGLAGAALLLLVLTAARSQSPGQGSTRTEERALGLKVPNVVGWNEFDAWAILESSGFQPRSLDTIGNDHRGTVVRTYPIAGMIMVRGARVDMWVRRAGSNATTALDADTVKGGVPDVVGMTWAVAARKLSEWGFNSSKVIASGPDTMSGKVIRQIPSGGHWATKGSTIRCEVGQSQKPIEESAGDSSQNGVASATTTSSSRPVDWTVAFGIFWAGTLVIALACVSVVEYRARRRLRNDAVRQINEAVVRPAPVTIGSNSSGSSVRPSDAARRAGQNTASNGQRSPLEAPTTVSLTAAELQIVRIVARDWGDSQKYWVSEFKKLRDNVAQLEERLDRSSREPGVGASTGLTAAELQAVRAGVVAWDYWVGEFKKLRDGLAAQGVVTASDNLKTAILALESRLASLEQGAGASQSGGVPSPSNAKQLEVSGQVERITVSLDDLRKRVMQIERIGTKPEDEPDPIDWNDVVDAFNSALTMPTRERDFRRIYKPRLVRLVHRGTDALLVEQSGGSLLVLHQQDTWLIVPALDVTHYDRSDLESCFDLVTQAAVDAPHYALELREAATCEPVDDGWRMAARGVLVVGS